MSTKPARAPERASPAYTAQPTADLPAPGGPHSHMTESRSSRTRALWQAATGPGNLVLRREPGVKPGRDPLCRRRIRVRKHDRDVAGLQVDPQVPVHSRRAAAVAHRAVPLRVPAIFEPVGVSGA